MLCRDVMRRPVHCAASHESAQSAAQRMQDANIGFLPVCDEGGSLVGVVTDRDLALRVCADGSSATGIRVADIASGAVVSCRPDEDLTRAEELMVREKKSRIVVTDAKGGVEGVISLSDVAMADTARAAGILREVAAREVLDSGGTLRSEDPARRPRPSPS